MKYCSTIRKKEMLSIATTWMDLEGVMLCEISETEKDKDGVILPKCGFLKKI